MKKNLLIVVLIIITIASMIYAQIQRVQIENTTAMAKLNYEKFEDEKSKVKACEMRTIGAEHEGIIAMERAAIAEMRVAECCK